MKNIKVKANKKINKPNAAGRFTKGEVPRIEDLDPDAAWVFDERHGINPGETFTDGMEIESIMGGDWAIMTASIRGTVLEDGPTYMEEGGFGFADIRTKGEEDSGRYFFSMNNELSTNELDPWLDTGGAILMSIRKQDWRTYENPSLIGASESIYGHHYSFDHKGIMMRQGWATDQVTEPHGSSTPVNNGGVSGLRWRADSINHARVISDPGIVRDQISDKWISIGVTWDRDNAIFFRDGDVWSRNKILGDLLDPESRPHSPKFPLTIGGHRWGRWPFQGDVRACAIWTRKIKESTAEEFHKSQIPSV